MPKFPSLIVTAALLAATPANAQSGATDYPNKPVRVVVTVPAGGKHSCVIRQTNNGQPVESKSTHASSEDALRGGLGDLKAFLGWE